MSQADRLKDKIGLTGPASQPIPREPPRIPDHELVRPIGEGGYGEVWLARNLVGTGRAVKVVYRSSFGDSRPYEREFTGMQKFEPISRSCEGLVHLLQMGRNDPAGYFYYVMELADDLNAAVENRMTAAGQTRSRPTPGSATPRPATSRLAVPDPHSYVPKTLAEVRARRGRLPPAECVQIGLSLTQALAHLHAHGLLHRDIKPSNIIFVNGRPKLADIGLVAETSEARSLVGTEGFIPPEGPLSPQADIYSLGKVLYEIATGKDRQQFPEPFTGACIGCATSGLRRGEANAAAVARGRPADWQVPGTPANTPPVGELAASTSPPVASADFEVLLELNAVILKACASDCRERYASADQMQADLALLQRGKSVRRLRLTRRWLGWLAKAAVAAALLAIAVWGLNAWLEYRVRQLQTLPSTGTGRLAGKVPPRDPRATPSQIDLASHYNVLLEENWFGPQGNNLAAIRPGLHTFGGVRFDVRGLVQLASPDVRHGAGGAFPQSVGGVGLDLNCDRLHFLQGAVGAASEGQEIGRYIVRYANGAQAVVPIRYGVDVRDCWSWAGGPQLTTNAAVAWRGQNAATRARGFTLQLYRMTWRNPMPGVRISSLDFESSSSPSAPFLVAITADPHLARGEVAGPTFLDRIQADAARYLRIRTSRVFGDPAFQRVRLNTAGRHAGSAFYDAIRFTAPPEPGWDLVFLVTWTNRAWVHSWQIMPVRGIMRVGFEDWYDGPRALFKNLPGSLREAVALQYLNGKKLRPGADYLIWFTFGTSQPEGIRLAISFIRSGRVQPGNPKSLEAALGLQRADRLSGARGRGAGTNTPSRLERHFCLSAARW